MADRRTGIARPCDLRSTGERRRLRRRRPAPGPPEPGRHGTNGRALPTRRGGDGRDRRGSPFVGEAQRTGDRDLVSAVSLAGDVREPCARHRPLAHRHDSSDPLAAGRQAPRHDAAAALPRHARLLAGDRQPHARIHPVGLWRAARQPTASRASAGAGRRSSVGEPRGGERTDRVGRGARLDSAPGATPCAGGLPAGRLETGGHPGRPHRSVRGTGRGRAAVGHIHLALREHATRAASTLERRAAKPDHPRRRDDLRAHPRPRRRRAGRADGLAGTAHRRDRRPAPRHRLQLCLCASQSSPAADALEQRAQGPHLPGQHRRARRPDRARHLPRLRAHPGWAR